MYVQCSEPYSSVAEEHIRGITCLLRQILYIGETGINYFRSSVSSRGFLFAPLIWINRDRGYRCKVWYIIDGQFMRDLITYSSFKQKPAVHCSYSCKCLIVVQLIQLMMEFVREAVRATKKVQEWWRERQLHVFFPTFLLLSSPFSYYSACGRHSSPRLLYSTPHVVFWGGN